MSSFTEPKITVPKKYLTSSMPTRGSYHGEDSVYNQPVYYNSNSTDETLISQPLPNTVKIMNEKSNLHKKDSFWLGW